MAAEKTTDPTTENNHIPSGSDPLLTKGFEGNTEHSRYTRKIESGESPRDTIVEEAAEKLHNVPKERPTTATGAPLNPEKCGVFEAAEKSGAPSKKEGAKVPPFDITRSLNHDYPFEDESHKVLDPTTITGGDGITTCHLKCVVSDNKVASGTNVGCTGHSVDTE